MSAVTVLGNATVDVIQRVERLPSFGETLLSSSLERCAGGKGLNQAIAADRAGAFVRLVAPIGRDADATFLTEAIAAEERLTVDWRLLEAPTDISSIWVSADGENMIVSSAACATALTAEDAVQALRSMEAGDVLVLQGNLPSETTEAAARHAKDRRCRVVLNTAPIAWDMLPLLKYIDVLVANGPEAAHLTGLATPEAITALLCAGCGAAIVTRGGDGAWLGDGEGLRSVAAPKVRPVDTAGAGDVAVGTLAAMLAEGLNLDDALQVAIKAASLSVTRHGTTPSFPTWDEVSVFRQQRRQVFAPLHL